MNILVLAMGRSGMHAVIRWIARGLPGTVYFYSHCINGWDNKELNPNKIVKEKRGSDDEIHRISSIEDFYLPLWEKIKDFEKFDHVVTVMRSPRNWLSSSIKIGGWARDYLQQAPRDCHYLPVSRIDAYKNYSLSRCVATTRVLYDMWLDDCGYRQRKAQSLGIRETGIPEQCKFSSFKRPFDHNEDRYKHLSRREKKWFKAMYDEDMQRIQGGFNNESMCTVFEKLEIK